VNTRFIASAAAMAILSLLLGLLIHGVVLRSNYAQLPDLMRPMAQAWAKMPYLVLAHGFFGAAFTWVFLQFKPEQPWLKQGALYALVICCLTTIPLYLIEHAVMAVPLGLTLKGLILDSLRVLLMGVALAWLSQFSFMRWISGLARTSAPDPGADPAKREPQLQQPKL